MFLKPLFWIFCRTMGCEPSVLARRQLDGRHGHGLMITNYKVVIGSRVLLWLYELHRFPIMATAQGV